MGMMGQHIYSLRVLGHKGISIYYCKGYISSNLGNMGSDHNC